MTRADATYLKRSIRATVREAIWLATSRHEQGAKPNILLFATRRGGSTWAMELIAANRGVRPLNQPLGTLSRNITYGQMLELPRFHEGQITSLSASESERMKSVIDRIMAGEIVINAPTDFWSKDYVRTSNRLVLKITDAKPVIGWFDQFIDAQIVYLTRHPIPQALSCIRNGWTLTVSSHLRDPAFAEANLNSEAEALAHDVMAGENELQKFVLNWALENVAALRLLGDRPSWTHIRYEDCVRDPQHVLGVLAERLGLDDWDRMRARVERPSGSSRRSTSGTVRAIEAGDGRSALDAWRTKVDDLDQRRARDLLEVFGIDLSLIAA